MKFLLVGWACGAWGLAWEALGFLACVGEEDSDVSLPFIAGNLFGGDVLDPLFLGGGLHFEAARMEIVTMKSFCHVK